MKSFLQLRKNLQLHSKKEPYQSYFLITFEKIFQNTVLCQEQKELQKELKYSLEYVLEKSSDETVTKFFFS